MQILPHVTAVDRDIDLDVARVCRVCGARAVEELLPVRSVPLYCNVLRKDRGAAVDAPRGALALTACHACSHVYNRAFDASALDYTPEYENSLHHSAHFSKYAEDLAHRLVDTYALHGKFVVDVGCGSGDFLALLCRLGGNRGQGYDRSCPTGRLSGAGDADVTLIPEFFSHTLALDPIDFLCCRQVLEHIADPVEFMVELKRSPSVTASTVLFFEVPNADYTFHGDGIWDLIYEHCSYFSKKSIVTLFERCGFDVIATYDLFSGQYLGLEARLASGSVRQSPAAHAHGPAPTHFADRYGAKVAHWQAAVDEWAKAGERIVIWGAGSKGVSFLDVLRPSPIEFAVDLHPRKVGRFLPGGGTEVVAPEFLSDYRPDRVILMNAIYRDEVSAMLARLGLSPTIVAA